MDRVKGIDGLRALSALLVFGAHTRPQVTPGGIIGVEIFFVISGFVITRSLLAEYRSTGRLDLTAFYMRRMLRLWPALVAMVVPLALLFAYPWQEWAPQLFYFSNFTLPGYPNTAIHTWSLSLEEQFYLLWPLMFILVVGRRPFSSVLALATIATAWACFTYVTLDSWPAFKTIEYRPDFRMSPLFVGCTLAFSGDRALRRIGYLWPVALALLAWWALFIPSYGTMLPPIAEAAAVIIAKVATDQNSMLTRALHCKAIAALGAISYAFYLWHFPVTRYLAWQLGNWGCLTATTLLAAASWFLIERPIRRHRDRIITALRPFLRIPAAQRAA